MQIPTLEGLIFITSTVKSIHQPPRPDSLNPVIQPTYPVIFIKMGKRIWSCVSMLLSTFRTDRRAGAGLLVPLSVKEMEGRFICAFRIGLWYNMGQPALPLIPPIFGYHTLVHWTKAVMYALRICNQAASAMGRTTENLRKQMLNERDNSAKQLLGARPN